MNDKLTEIERLNALADSKHFDNIKIVVIPFQHGPDWFLCDDNSYTIDEMRRSVEYERARCLKIIKDFYHPYGLDFATAVISKIESGEA
jgi:hypothetical protein